MGYRGHNETSMVGAPYNAGSYKDGNHGERSLDKIVSGGSPQNLVSCTGEILDAVGNAAARKKP